MGPEMQRMLAELFHGWVGLLTLLIVLAACTVLVVWCHGRNLRPADRDRLLPANVLAPAFGLALVVQALGSTIWSALVLAVALIASSAIWRDTRQGSVRIPIFLAATLLGMGFTLSGAAVVVASAIALLLSGQPAKR